MRLRKEVMEGTKTRGKSMKLKAPMMRLIIQMEARKSRGSQEMREMSLEGLSTIRSRPSHPKGNDYQSFRNPL